MIGIEPADFLRDFCAPFDCQDHHFTGGTHGNQPEGEGSVFHIEGQILAGFAARHGGPVVEIGSDRGISTRYIHEGLARATSPQDYFPDGSYLGDNVIIAFDPMHKWFAANKWPHLRQYHTSCPRLIGWSTRWAFIDGDHRYPAVVDDIRAVAGAGVQHILFHDTVPTCPIPTGTSDGSEARRAALDILDVPGGWDLWDILTPCGMVYARRRPS